MHRLVAVLSLLAGCDFTFNLDHLKDPIVDADGGGDTVDAVSCFGRNGEGSAGLARVCLEQTPPESWTPNGELHTGALMNPADCMQVSEQSGTTSDLCVIAAHNITIGSYVPTSGSRPIVFIATDTFTLLEAGSIGVDTRRNGSRKGAGANEPSCPSNPNGTASTTGASGGAGGSFATKGGNGGKGAGTPSGTSSSAAVTGVAFVRGGCKGGDGGSGIAGAGTGDGGTSGGAVYIIAGNQIEIRGTIDASGEGGGGGAVALSTATGGDGGGGGGSGGLIGLDAPSIKITSTAILVANGGGGGGGGGGSIGGTAGGTGKESQLTIPPAFPAPGGTGGSAGASTGAGGKGASGSAAPDPGQPDGASVARSAGGGGGGGAGIIQFFAVTLDNQSTNISPPP